MSKNLTPQNKVTKKDLAEMIKQLAVQQQGHAITLQQISGLCFAIASFVGGKITGCHKCQKYIVVDPGVTKCPDCGDGLDFGPGEQDGPEQKRPTED